VRAQAAGHAGHCALVHHLGGHGWELRHALAGVGPGDGVQVLCGGAVRLEGRLVAQVQDDGLADQRVSGLDTSCKGVEAGHFLEVEGVGLGLSPAFRK